MATEPTATAANRLYSPSRDVEAGEQHRGLAGHGDAGALEHHQHEHAREPHRVDHVHGRVDDRVRDRGDHGHSEGGRVAGFRWPSRCSPAPDAVHAAPRRAPEPRPRGPASTSSARRSRPSSASSPSTSARATRSASPTAPRRSRSRLRAVGVEAGDDVVVPSFTFYASAEAVAAIGARPVFCDVDPETFLVTPGDRQGGAHAEDEGDRRRCTCSATWRRSPQLLELGLPVLEDSAQATGATLDGARAGALGTRRDVLLLPVQEPALPRRRRRDHDRRRRGRRARAHPALPRLQGQAHLHRRRLQLAPRRAAGRRAARAAAASSTAGTRPAARSRPRTSATASASTSACRGRRPAPSTSTTSTSCASERADELQAALAERGVGAAAPTTACRSTASRRWRPTWSCRAPSRPPARTSPCRWARSSLTSRSARSWTHARLGRPDQQPARARAAPADRADAGRRPRGGGDRARLRADAASCASASASTTPPSGATAASGWREQGARPGPAQRRARCAGRAGGRRFDVAIGHGSNDVAVAAKLLRRAERDRLRLRVRPRSSTTSTAGWRAW